MHGLSKEPVGVLDTWFVPVYQSNDDSQGIAGENPILRKRANFKQRITR